MRLTLAIQKSKEEKQEEMKEKASALNDLVDLNFGGPVTGGGPNPPQRTAASLDPWSPMGEGASAATGDPWGGMGAINTSTIPDPWGGIGAVGVPPSRASPLAFSSSPPRPSNSDPWGSATEPTTTSVSNDPWAAPADLPASVSPAPAKTAVDPFSPGDPNDVMSAFGGNGHGAGGGFGGSPLQGTVSPTMGGQQTQSPNPWDLSGLDPMGGQTDLLGNNVGMSTGAKPKKIVER